MSILYDGEALRRKLVETQTCVKAIHEGAKAARDGLRVKKTRWGSVRMDLSVFLARTADRSSPAQETLLDTERHLQLLEELETMIWYGRVPGFFVCVHYMNGVTGDLFRFDTYDFQSGPNFHTAAPEPDDTFSVYLATKHLEHDCRCCPVCVTAIRDLHLLYKQYRLLELNRLLPHLPPDLRELVRHYLVPPRNDIT